MRLPVTFSDQEKAEFKSDKKKYQAFRKGIVDHLRCVLKVEMANITIPYSH